MLHGCDIVVILKAACDVRVRSDFSGALSTNIKSSLEDIFSLLFREREKEGEREGEGEKHGLVPGTEPTT